LGEQGVWVSGEPLFPRGGEVGNRGAGAKEATDIDLILLNLAKADVAMRREVHFESRTQIDIVSVGFESKPAPALLGSGGLASCG
jgi:hypothetical protein